MPIGRMPTAASTAPKTGAAAKTDAGRTVFRPPWVKGEAGEAPEAKLTSWRRPSATATTPDTNSKTNNEKTESTTLPAKRNTVKTQQSTTKAPTENGKPETPAVSAKLQSREIKVPIMTEQKKPAPVPLKTSLKPVEQKEKETINPEEKRPFDKHKLLRKAETPNKMPLKKELSRDDSTDDTKHKFVRPILRKTPKVEDTFKEKEKTKIPQVDLKRAETIKREAEKPNKIEVSLSRTVINKKEPEKPKSSRKLEPVKTPFGKKSKALDEEDESSEEEESDEEEEVEEEEEEETEEEESTEEESEDEDTEKDSKTKVAPKASGPPPPPPPPPPPAMAGPPPPPPPPPAGDTPAVEVEKKPMSDTQKRFLEKLKTRPRKRPDWSDMMKEVESGRKLKHVQCNDRSNPILKSKSMAKIKVKEKEQYVFETEKEQKEGKLNELLEEIQTGVRLRPTKTNDRSKPNLDGLRKFRRQMTVDEQLQKSESRAVLNTEPGIVPPVEFESPDEMDDIDKLRDDLQSTKQLLAIELRNREAQERENKRLEARVKNLEAELSREKWNPMASAEDSQPKTADEKLVASLKSEAEEAQKTSKTLEKKFHDTAEQLDKAKLEIDEQKRQVAALEKRLGMALQEKESSNKIKWNYSYVWKNDDLDSSFWDDDDDEYGVGSYDGNRRQSEAQTRDSSPEPEPEVSESDENEDEEKKAERRERRSARDVRLLRGKLTRYKEKQKVAKREQEALKTLMKKNTVILKDEKKKLKKLQKEVDKMAALMKDVDDEEEDGEEKEDKPEPEEEEEPESEEEESSEEESSDESDNEKSQSESEDAPTDKQKDNLEPRVKRHENRLSALKKGNLLLQANVDGLQDEINKTRDTAVTMQADLNSVLSELG